MKLRMFFLVFVNLLLDHVDVVLGTLLSEDQWPAPEPSPTPIPTPVPTNGSFHVSTSIVATITVLVAMALGIDTSFRV